MSGKVISLDSLPFEIIEIILRYDVISFVDICNLSTVCQLFNCIGKSNRLWSEKFKKMWPKLVSCYDSCSTDWKNEFCIRFQFGNMINKKLEEMAELYYYQDSVSNDSFLQLRELCANHVLSDEFLLDELEKIIHYSEFHSNLTHKYYAKRILRYMRHALLENVWRKVLSDNQKKLTLLKGACLISQWCQPTKIHNSSNVLNEINSIVNMVFQYISKMFPKHPVLKRDLSNLEWENGEVLELSLWTPRECRQILCAINDVMFNYLKFCGNVDHFYSASNSYIDKVLANKVGIPITLGIVYETVASQLGVCCLPVNFPGHFLLKWKEHPHFADDEAFTYIDVYDKGQFKTWRELEDLSPGYDAFSRSWIEAVSPLKVFTRMCWNLVEVARQRDGEGEGLLCLCNALELLSILSPDDMEHKLLLARVYMHLCVNMTRVISLLQEIADQDPTSTGIVGYMYRAAITTLESQKSRSSRVENLKSQPRSEDCNVGFAIGMIMKHKKYNYRCVIYGWDSVCTASEDWIRQMGVYNLPHQEKQPFYHVLVEDGTNRYAAQENLEIDSENKPVQHNEVGKFFESFHENYYLPNKLKRLEYPDDIAARERALANGTAVLEK